MLGVWGGQRPGRGGGAERPGEGVAKRRGCNHTGWQSTVPWCGPVPGSVGPSEVSGTGQRPGITYYSSYEGLRFCFEGLAPGPPTRMWKNYRQNPGLGD